MFNKYGETYESLPPYASQTQYKSLWNNLSISYDCTLDYAGNSIHNHGKDKYWYVCIYITLKFIIADTYIYIYFNTLKICTMETKCYIIL